MGRQKERLCGEQPQSQDQVSGAPLDASHRVSDLREDGNSCEEDIRKLEAEASALAASAAEMRADIQASERRLRIFDAIIESDFTADEKIAFLKEANK